MPSYITTSRYEAATYSAFGFALAATTTDNEGKVNFEFPIPANKEQEHRRLQAVMGEHPPYGWKFSVPDLGIWIENLELMTRLIRSSRSDGLGSPSRFK